MARSNKYRKHIFCLEAELDNNLKNESSSRHILHQLHNFSDGKIDYIHRKCATIDEFKYYLKKLSLKKHIEYSIVYLSFHGSSNKIYFGNKGVSLKELAELSGDSFKNKIVHFGSCETINIDEEEMKLFFKQTKPLAVSGFTKSVDFIESVALELIYFSWCQEYLNTKTIEKKIMERYKGLIEITGFKIIQRL